MRFDQDLIKEEQDEVNEDDHTSESRKRKHPNVIIEGCESEIGVSHGYASF